jgi:hypothetical protein
MDLFYGPGQRAIPSHSPYLFTGVPFGEGFIRWSAPGNPFWPFPPPSIVHSFFLLLFWPAPKCHNCFWPFLVGFFSAFQPVANSPLLSTHFMPLVPISVHLSPSLPFPPLFRMASLEAAIPPIRKTHKSTIYFDLHRSQLLTIIPLKPKFF